MFLFDEKRGSGDRRVSDEGPPAGCRERRSLGDRRQTVIAEISLHEWASHFIKFKENSAVLGCPTDSANAPEARIKSGS